MNARWFRNHLVSIIAGTVFVALLALLLWFYSEARRQQEEVLKDLESQHSELEALNNAKVFPSKKNIESLKRDYDNVKQLYDAMRGAATHPLMQGPALTRDIDFSQLMRTTVNRLNLITAEQHVRTPDQFAFGFSRYIEKFPCRNPVASHDECTRLLALLSKQLVTVETLTGLLVSNKVEDITAIHRTEVEPGESSADALNLPIHIEPNALYHTYPFELRFSCDTLVLRNFLNALMQADGLFIVRALKIDTVGVQLKSLDMPTANGEPDPAAVRSEVRKRRLSVALQLDLVEFAPTVETPSGSGVKLGTRYGLH